MAIAAWTICLWDLKKRSDNYDLIDIWKIFLTRLYISKHAENQEDSTNIVPFYKSLTWNWTWNEA